VKKKQTGALNSTFFLDWKSKANQFLAWNLGSFQGDAFGGAICFLEQRMNELSYLMNLFAVFV